MNLPPISEELVASYVGNGAPMLMRRALGPDASEADVQRALEFFLGYYREHMLDNTRLYPGVLEGSAGSHGGSGARMAVAYQSPVRFSRAIVEGLGLGGHFFQIYGGNSFEQKKPGTRLGLRSCSKRVEFRASAPSWWETVVWTSERRATRR